MVGNDTWDHGHCIHDGAQHEDPVPSVQIVFVEAARPSQLTSLLRTAQSYGNVALIAGGVVQVANAVIGSPTGPIAVTSSCLFFAAATTLLMEVPVALGRGLAPYLAHQKAE